VFENAFTNFNEDDDEEDHEQRPTQRPQAPRPDVHVIKVVDGNYDVLHNILFYIYTDRLTLTLDFEDSVPGQGLPKPCDPEFIYEASLKLGLEKLKTRTLDFLQITCSKKNITERLFGWGADEFPELRKVYEGYFTNHWKDIRGSTVHKDAIDDLEADDLRKYTRLLERLSLN